jgi:predicted small lipoprotein YifL
VLAVIRARSATRVRSAILAAAVVALIAVGCGSPGPATAPPAGVPQQSSGPPRSADPPAVGDGPPDAALLVPDGDPVVGQLGTYVWRDAGSDSPWLPGTPVELVGGRSILFGLRAAVPVETWAAAYADVRVEPGSVPRSIPLQSLAVPLEVAPPPPGRWTVVLRVTFGDGLGEAGYFWLVTMR